MKWLVFFWKHCQLPDSTIQYNTYVILILVKFSRVNNLINHFLKIFPSYPFLTPSFPLSLSTYFFPSHPAIFPSFLLFAIPTPFQLLHIVLKRLFSNVQLLFYLDNFWKMITRENIFHYRGPSKNSKMTVKYRMN